MAPPISSVLFPDDVSARTPQLRQQINAHGYLTVVAEPEQLTATFRVLDDVQDPRSAISTRRHLAGRRRRPDTPAGVILSGGSIGRERARS